MPHSVNCPNVASKPRAMAVVVHSGGMDSSICLALACQRYGPSEVVSMSFRYGQRHSEELTRASTIARHLGVRHIVLDIDCLQAITTNALMDEGCEIATQKGLPPNTMVVGRNGLMVRIAAIHAHELGASCVYTGVIELEGEHSGYPDCSRVYMDKMADILRLDLANPHFTIETPLVFMSKSETLEVAHTLGILTFLLETTITCYRGIDKQGCMSCPACLLRNEGIAAFLRKHPEFKLSYRSALGAEAPGALGDGPKRVGRG